MKDPVQLPHEEDWVRRPRYRVLQNERNPLSPISSHDRIPNDPDYLVPVKEDGK